MQGPSVGKITKLDLSINIGNHGSDGFEQITGGFNGSYGIFPPQIIIGTASVGGRLAPENTVITAWQNDGEDLVGATVVRNQPDGYTGDLTMTLSPLGDNLNNVMGFDNEAKEWTFYDPRMSFVDFSSIKTMQDNVAYYIDVAEPQTVSLDGLPYRLYEGLNVVPWGEYNSANRLAISPKDGLSSLIQDENLIRIWQFNNEYQNWSFFDPREAFAVANTLLTLSDNEVIWLQVNRDVDTTINGAVLKLHSPSYLADSNLIIWRHGPLDSSNTITPGPLPTSNLNSPVDVYVGAVTIGGNPALDGTEVTAWLSEFNAPIGTSFTSESSYALVAGQYGADSFSGKTVLFKVNGQEVGRATYVPGGATVLDLVVP